MKAEAEVEAEVDAEVEVEEGQNSVAMKVAKDTSVARLAPRVQVTIPAGGPGGAHSTPRRGVHCVFGVHRAREESPNAG